jgi:N-acetylglutamate synthase-like GNAT family acetyltransferase
MVKRVEDMAERIVVRVAGSDDAEAIGAVLRASYPKLMAPAYPADVLARALPFMVRANPALLRSGTYYLAATPDGTVVGCGGWTFERPGEPGSAIYPTQGHIRHFATHPNWIRRGIGRTLFERCVAEARAVGVQRFECYASVVAQPFYAALGFVTVGPTTIELEPGLTFSGPRMICHLTNRATDPP